ncbi:substrate-binding periplasmic protein [Inhella sp.]|uniref:substrate-binding periplasmic protein n=1 Tax=Inhella sp. TaxID=1921806 RepID=UPI0035B3E582
MHTHLPSSLQRRSIWRCPWAIGLVLALGGWAAAAASAASECGTVRVGLNSVAAETWFNEGSSSPEGALAELARKALGTVGCKVELQRMPLARLLLDAERGAIDLALVITVTEERRRAMRFPETGAGELDPRHALGQSRVSLVGLASEAAVLNRRRQDPKDLNLTVAVQRGSVGAERAKAAGWTLTYAPDPQRAAAMVRLGRADLLAGPDWSISPRALNEEPALEVLEPPLALQPYYAPVSQAFWKRDPQRVQAIWRALCQNAALLGGRPAAVCPGLATSSARPEGKRQR